MRILALLILCSPAFATTYDIRTQADFANIQFGLLNDGDTITIHYSPTPYKARLFVSKGIKIVGELGPFGERPVIDGEGAPMYGKELLRVGYLRDFFSQAGCILTGTAAGVRITETYRGPKNVVIRNLVIQGAHNPVLMPNRTGTGKYDSLGNPGTTHDLLGMASGIYSWYSEGTEIDNCVLRDNGNGLFSVGSGQTRDIWIHGNSIVFNGIAGSYRQHGVYIEALGVLFENNHIYGPRPGMQGMAYKSRSGREIIRNNVIEDGMLLLGLEDPQEAGYIHTDPGFAETLVEGNTLIVHDGWADYGVHFGDDQISRNEDPAHQRHPEKSRPHLTFKNNTVKIMKSKGRLVMFDLRTGQNVVDATGNTITETHPVALYLLNDNGTLRLSGNTLPPYAKSLRPLKGSVTVN